MSLSDLIQQEATKLVKRHQRYAAELEERARRAERRTGVRPAKNVQLPAYWAADPGFDPYHVRSRAKGISHSIGRALANGQYTPRPAVAFNVPKDDGSPRRTSVFQVADNAISRALYRQLLAKNSARLSPHCYAYRTDITLHDAILNVAADLRGKKRIFIAEFDFSKYFDQISHNHLESLLSDRLYFITANERSIIQRFLVTPTLDTCEYDTSTTQTRKIGIPQGTSISLFLANIAAQPLDRRLERLGVGFARFADDTLIWSTDYSQICRAAEELERAALAMGVPINFSKSAGISLLVPRGAPAEFSPKHSVDFLGYNVAPDSIGIKEASIAEIKDWISYLVYSNLIREPQRGIFLPDRLLPNVDRDYVVLISQVRRYLYGDLSESQLRRHLAGTIPRPNFKGLLSFYPIVDNFEQLRELDGWLLRTVHLAIAARSRLLTNLGFTVLPPPHYQSKEDLLRLRSRAADGSNIDLRIPSFARMAKLLGKASAIFGANLVANPRTRYGSPLNKGVPRYTGLS